MPFLPLKDDNPLKVIAFQAVTVSIIVLCVMVFLWQLSVDAAGGQRIAISLGMVPALLFGAGELLAARAVIPAELTLLTSMFLHGGWLHLIGNMAYLWVFGDNVEDAMGHTRFLVFYLVCGVAGGLMHAGFNPDSVIPTVGASGAISGVLGAYLVMHPKVKVLVLALYRLPIRLPAYIVLGGWIAMQVFFVLTDRGGDEGGVAWWAHIGGLLAGLLLIVPFQRAQVPRLQVQAPPRVQMPRVRAKAPRRHRGPWERRK